MGPIKAQSGASASISISNPIGEASNISISNPIPIAYPITLTNTTKLLLHRSTYFEHRAHH